MRKVPKAKLGDTGLSVSKLGFGTYEFGVASFGINPEEGGRILTESHDLGVSLWDTSDDYGSHPHVAAGLRLVERDDVVVSTKTSARTRSQATKSLRNSLKELGTEYVDVFLLHEVKTDWLKGSREVIRELEHEKKAGHLKAIGLSTHSVNVVKEASRFEALDVIMTICCKADQSMISKYPDHIPLEDGSIEEMIEATRSAHKSGKAVIAMKVLGTSAPPLIADYRSAIESVARLDFVDAMIIGMRNLDQVKKNVRVILAC
jgi:aryl-alcohol dehydrogenase-like predicted oxidoreductase